MLKRSSPRSITCWSTAKGISFTSTLLTLPVKKASSSCSVPRATVPSTSGRALDPSAKNVLGRRPRYFGWLCMSWRHAETASRLTPANASSRSARRRPPRFPNSQSRIPLLCDVIDLSRPETLKKRTRRGVIELRIRRFDGQEEAILTGVFGKPRHVEHRVIRHGQTVQDEHAEDRRKRREENRELERDRDEHRP